MFVLQKYLFMKTYYNLQNYNLLNSFFYLIIGMNLVLKSFLHQINIF